MSQDHPKYLTTIELGPGGKFLLASDLLWLAQSDVLLRLAAPLMSSSRWEQSGSGRAVRYFQTGDLDTSACPVSIDHDARENLLLCLTSQ